MRNDATMTGMSDEEVSDNREQSRLEFHANGEVAELIYRTRAGRLVLVHTGVPDSLEGRGIGSKLVRAAITKAQNEKLTIVPLCPFARSWLENHPDVADNLVIDWGKGR